MKKDVVLLLEIRNPFQSGVREIYELWVSSLDLRLDLAGLLLEATCLKVFINYDA